MSCISDLVSLENIIQCFKRNNYKVLCLCSMAILRVKYLSWFAGCRPEAPILLFYQWLTATTVRVSTYLTLFN